MIMSLTIQLPSEFLRPTTSSNSPFSSPVFLGNTNTSAATNCAGLFIEISQVVQKQNKSKDVDDFINDLLAQDKIKESDLHKGRKLVADVLCDEGSDSLKILRLRAGYSQAQLAEKIGMKQPNVCEFEAGKRKPTIDTLMKLADALGTTTDVILKSIIQLE
jgi:DNA-binding XRE family transcriptional regulator